MGKIIFTVGKMNKRGVSEIIGYVLLMAVVITISVIVYQWLKSYVPQEALACPDGVSVAIPELVYNCSANSLNFTLENTGTFSITGYYIKATNSSTQEIATIDLAKYYAGDAGFVAGSAVQFAANNNTVLPGNIEDIKKNANFFNLNKFTNDVKPFPGTIASIEITPIMYVNYNGKKRVASCTSAILDEPIACS